MNKTKTILILSDSLAFPRERPEHVSYDQTYVSILQAKHLDYNFIHHGIGGATIKDIYNFANYFINTLEPKIVFIQCGIVDCAPRSYGKFELLFVKFICSKVPWVKRFFQMLGSVLFRIRLKQFTPLLSFKKHLSKLSNCFENCYFLTIIDAPHFYEKSKPGISCQITKYNSEIRKFNFVELSGITEQSLMSDGHHLNAMGHCFVATRLSKIIEENDN